MMIIEDYAADVEKSVEEILELCDKVGISYDDKDTLLDDISITLLDNKLQEMEEEEEVNDEALEEIIQKAEEDEKAEELAFDTKIDLDNEQKFTKVKQNKQAKKTENKKDFLKERKKIYKHREKLQSNEVTPDENVIIYKKGMTVTELAEALEIKPVDLVKKLIGLGVMANVNQSLDYDISIFH